LLRDGDGERAYLSAALVAAVRRYLSRDGECGCVVTRGDFDLLL